VEEVVLEGVLTEADMDAAIAALNERQVVNVMDPAFAPSILHTTGAIGDGELHPLSEYFANLAAAQAAYPHATALTDSRDWAAMQAAINSLAVHIGGGVYVPPPPTGYRLAASLTWSDRPICLFGDVACNSVPGPSDSSGTKLT
jgi:hypothetical protein